MLLKEATLDHWKLLLDWRNDLETRKNSHQMDLVSEEGHKAWLVRVLADPQRKLFIAYEGEEAVGTVRADYDTVSERYELSWTVAPSARGRGIGKHMVKQLVETLNTSVRAEIKEGNHSSVKIAVYAGLHFHEKKGDVLHYFN